MADPTHPPHSSYLEGQRLSRRAYNAPVRAMLAYWLGVHDQGQLPDRTRFELSALPAGLLPFVFQIERRPGNGWRLLSAGTHLAAALGQDFSGRDLVDDQIPSISRSRTLRLLGPVTETGLPGHFHGRSGFRFSDGYGDHEQVLVPFRGPGSERVELVVGAIVYEGLKDAP